MYLTLSSELDGVSVYHNMNGENQTFNSFQSGIHLCCQEKDNINKQESEEKKCGLMIIVMTAKRITMLY